MITDQAGTKLFSASEKTDFLPGIDQAAMVLCNVTQTKATYNNRNNLGENAVRMGMIPVYSHAAGFAGDCVRKGNIAAQDRGGFLISYSNPGFVMLHHCVHDNIAQTGTLLLLSRVVDSLHTRTTATVYSTIIEHNRASTCGGGVHRERHPTTHLMSIPMVMNMEVLSQ